mmetsp:Transcript_1862/g.4255  ORF Transcript_1862/g.4255 Transcript_1862/m.4255 type:complete len:225 (+) Transcript_1862:145-819(+)
MEDKGRGKGRPAWATCPAWQSAERQPLSPRTSCVVCSHLSSSAPHSAALKMSTCDVASSILSNQPNKVSLLLGPSSSSTQVACTFTKGCRTPKTETSSTDGLSPPPRNFPEARCSRSMSPYSWMLLSDFPCPTFLGPTQQSTQAATRRRQPNAPPIRIPQEHSSLQEPAVLFSPAIMRPKVTSLSMSSSSCVNGLPCRMGARLFTMMKESLICLGPMSSTGIFW